LEEISIILNSAPPSVVVVFVDSTNCGSG
jgi:hypothetical protein